MSDRSVARIIKEVRACAIAAGRSEAEATELAELCSGHSLRAGYCTASAMAGVPEWKARRRSRHRSAETFAGYVRAAELWTDSGLIKSLFARSMRKIDPEFVRWTVSRK